MLWLKIATLIYFAHEYVIWTRQNCGISWEAEVRAGRFISKMTHYGCQVGAIYLMIDQLSLRAWGLPVLSMQTGLPHTVVLGFLGQVF